MRFAIHLSCHKFEIFGKKTYNFYFGNSNCVQVKKEYFFYTKQRTNNMYFPKKSSRTLWCQQKTKNNNNKRKTGQSHP